MTLAAWLHDLSPFAIRFTDSFGLRWYGLSYALGFLVGWMVLRGLARRGVALIPPERVGDAILYVVVGVVAGGRLGYAVFYKPSLFWSFEPGFPWWQLLAVHEGGMASHGGMIGVIIAAWMISRGCKEPGGSRGGRLPLLHVLDLLCLVAPFGLFFGRLANFVNGELLGRVVAPPGEPAPWWSVKYPQELLDTVPPRDAALEHLVRSYTLAGEGFESGCARMLERLQAGAPGLAEQVAPLVSARHPSQLYQAAAEGVVLGLVVWLVARSARKPGIIGCWFLITYGVLRVVTEVWRLPDAHLVQKHLFGLTRGQWLSVLMVVIGLAFLVWIGRSRAAAMGGWGRSATAAPVNGR